MGLIGVTGHIGISEEKAKSHTAELVQVAEEDLGLGEHDEPLHLHLQQEDEEEGEDGPS